MFPLYEKELPKTARDLSHALMGSLQRAVQVGGDFVSIRENAYPDLAEIAIDLSGGKVRMNAPRPPWPTKEGSAAITAQRFLLKAQPLSLSDAAVNLAIVADGIVLQSSSDDAGNLFLRLQRAANGQIVVAIRKRDLEMLIDQVAKSQAGKQGIAIEQVELNLTSRGSRSLGAEVRVHARKLFIRTMIRIAGVLEIDNQFEAHLSGLACSGEGAIGTLACGVLTPYLQALESRRFPLLALPLGELQLRDIHLYVADGIEVSAEFGASPV
jgi:hypothetical protein